MNAKLLTEHHLEFVSLKGGCTSQNATLLKITCHGSNFVVGFHNNGILSFSLLYRVLFYMSIISSEPLEEFEGFVV